MNLKYELTDETKQCGGKTLYRIKALKDFSDVKSGDLGGWVESEDNLSQQGECWVYGDAVLSGYMWAVGNARVGGKKI
jgi:hypothetical protein